MRLSNAITTGTLLIEMFSLVVPQAMAKHQKSLGLLMLDVKQGQSSQVIYFNQQELEEFLLDPCR